MSKPFFLQVTGSAMRMRDYVAHVDRKDRTIWLGDYDSKNIHYIDDMTVLDEKEKEKYVIEHPFNSKYHYFIDI